MSDGLEPIDDGEILYRRVPATAKPPWYDPEKDELSDQAFAPHRSNDISGLSICFAKYRCIENVGRPGKADYVAVLEAGAIRRAGMQIEPRPETETGFDASHAELPDLNSFNRKDDQTLERQRVLVQLSRVEGPFPKPPPHS